MNGPYHIVYVSDARFRPYVDVSAASLRRSASGEVVVHVIDTDNPAIGNRLADLDEYHGSRATFARLLAPELLPDVDWALYVDGDTLCVGDVCEVFKYCDDTKLIVGSRDPSGFNLGPDVESGWLRDRGLSFDTHICAGVMLMNLKAMREEGVVGKCFDFLRQYGTPPLVDQTVLNCVCKGRIGVLPPQWGVFSMVPEGVDFTQSAIIHYPQDLPWRRERANKLGHDLVWLWWKFVESEKCKVRSEKLRSGGFSFWRRWAYLMIKCCPWIVTWSPYLRAHLRPLRGLTRRERDVILSRWKR